MWKLNFKQASHHNQYTDTSLSTVVCSHGFAAEYSRLLTPWLLHGEYSHWLG